MNVTKETVTPKKALTWLKRNVANRPLSSGTVNSYAKAISCGAWKLNGDSIRFNGNGDLIDGQHRLHACVKCGEPFESYVIRGLDHDAFDTIDQGKKRTTSDVFARDGYKHYTTLASAVRWFHTVHVAGFGKVSAMRPDEAHQILEDNPRIHWAVDLSRRLCGHGRIIHPGLLGFLIHDTSTRDEKKCEEFWSAAIAGEGLTKGTPAHLLHKRLVSNLGSVAKISSITMAALAIKAWNCHRSGKPCGTLKWSDGEEFPKILS